MDACIRTSCTDEFHFFSGQPVQDRFQLTLDGHICVWLVLPAEVAGTIIADRHLIIWHGQPP